MYIEWHDVPGVTEYQIGFSFPCARKFGWEKIGPGYLEDCCTYNYPAKHGHLHVRTEEGVGRFLFCCFSHEGVKRLVQCLEKKGLINAVAVDMILNLPEVQVLPELLCEVEKRVLRSPLKWKRDYNFVITRR